MKKALALAIALWPLAAPDARTAPGCDRPAALAAPLDGPLQPLRRVEDYHVVLESCHSATRGQKLAIRNMRVDGDAYFLVVDPESLETSLESAACWTCQATTAEAQAATRFIRAVDRYAAAPGKKPPAGARWLANAGLTASPQGQGAFVTGDLCPSLKALDRDFLQKLEKTGAAPPVALSVSGLWIERHAEDFHWLRREKAEKRLAITFVNHSYHHPYRPGLGDGQNFLLVPDLKDREGEILDVERLLIANGETPSVFFRFPGLISDRDWMERLKADHLIPLGSDAWLALPQDAKPGAIVLIHANGNEPFGLSRFQKLQKTTMPQPFRPLNEAP
jgi:hypothetical protein